MGQFYVVVSWIQFAEYRQLLYKIRFQMFLFWAVSAKMIKKKFKNNKNNSKLLEINS